MSSTAELFLKAALVGVGGTIVLDLYALMMSRVLGVPATNWAMVGRWFGNMAHGQFVQVAMSEAVPVKGELAIGWIAHYAIGIGYGLLLLGLWGKVWLERPTLLPPMILAWVLLVAPYLVLMPGMGMGIAGSRTPKPNVTRLKSVMGHRFSASACTRPDGYSPRIGRLWRERKQHKFGGCHAGSELDPKGRSGDRWRFP